jgi:4'-phosphopantetheinyl transferase
MMRDDVMRGLPGSLPTGDAVHLWVIDLDVMPSVVESLKVVLDAQELLRCSRLRSTELRSRFAVAHGTLRHVLGRYLGVPGSHVELERQASGKPRLKDESFVFNLSHSGGVAVLAIAAGGKLGVDVELVRAMPDASDIARSNFSLRETAEFLALPDRSRSRGFFNAWTRKEAVVKATGDGLSLPLDSFDVSLADTPARLVRAPEGEDAARWTLYSFEPRTGYVGALAIDRRIERVSRYTWHPLTMSVVRAVRDDRLPLHSTGGH